jgi:2-methylcitrate dehydratase PrpD
MTPDATLIHHLAETKYENVPHEALERARLAILDTLGVAIAGTARLEVRPVVQLVLEAGGRPESNVIGAGMRVPAPQACLANGTLARTWDFDDIFKGSIAAGHADVNIVPAALAVAERIGEVPGRDVQTAVALAEDLFCRLSLAIKTDHTETGRYNMFSIFAPAAAAAKLLGLGADGMANALGIAYAQAAGEEQKYQNSALTIALQNGFVPMAGVLSALLAARGITGARDVFTGRHGFFHVFERDHDLEPLTRDLGRKYASLGLAIKPYPCCSCTHTSIEAALHIARLHDLQAEDIARVRIGLNQSSFNATCQPQALKWNPRSTSSRQFSAPYAVAVALHERRVSIESFLPNAERDVSIWKLLEATEAAVDQDIQATFGHLADGPARVSVQTKSGVELTHFVEYEKGHVMNPMTWPDVFEKFKGCWQTAGIPLDGRVTELGELIARLEGLEDLDPLWGLLHSIRTSGSGPHTSDRINT